MSTTRTHSTSRYTRKWNEMALRMASKNGIGNILEIVLLTLIRIHSDWLDMNY